MVLCRFFGDGGQLIGAHAQGGQACRQSNGVDELCHPVMEIGPGLDVHDPAKIDKGGVRMAPVEAQDMRQQNADQRAVMKMQLAKRGRHRMRAAKRLLKTHAAHQ